MNAQNRESLIDECQRKSNQAAYRLDKEKCRLAEAQFAVRIAEMSVAAEEEQVRWWEARMQELE